MNHFACSELGIEFSDKLAYQVKVAAPSRDYKSNCSKSASLVAGAPSINIHILTEVVNLLIWIPCSIEYFESSIMKFEDNETMSTSGGYSFVITWVISTSLSCYCTYLITRSTMLAMMMILRVGTVIGLDDTVGIVYNRTVPRAPLLRI